MPEPLYVCLLVLRRELQIPLGPPEQVLQHTALHAIHLIGQEALRGNAEVEADNFQRIKTYPGHPGQYGGRATPGGLHTLQLHNCGGSHQGIGSAWHSARYAASPCI